MTLCSRPLDAQILVVDDCVRSATSLAEVLRMEGYCQVTSTTDSTQISMLHRRHDYDLILLDLRMPDLDGFAVMADLKKTGATDYLPIIAITGYTSLKLAALEAGALDFLAKPYDLRELKLRVRNSLAIRLHHRLLTQQARHHEAMALHDGLTGLPNRRLLLDRINSALQYARRTGRGLAIMYIDLDGFKAINDRHGHACGDALLQMVASRLANAVRSADTVGRLSGDECAVVLPDMQDTQEAAIPAGKIVQSLAMPFNMGMIRVEISASVGIAFYSKHTDTVQSLLDSADKALYQIKKTGKNGFCFAPSGLEIQPEMMEESGSNFIPSPIHPVSNTDGRRAKTIEGLSR